MTTEPDDGAAAVAISSDGTYIAAFSHSGTGLIWHEPTHAVVWCGQVEGIAPTAVAFIDGDHAILTLSESNDRDSAGEYGLTLATLALTTGPG